MRRILDDPKIHKPLVLGFFREYFDYHRAPEVFKDPLPQYLQRRGVSHNPRSSVDDTDVLVLSVLSRDRDVLQDLLTTPESYATHELFGPAGTLDGLRSGEALFQGFGPLALEHRRDTNRGTGLQAGPKVSVKLLSLNRESIVHGLERVFGVQFMDASVYLMSDLPARVEPGDVLLIAGTAFALCCLSTLYPAWRAATTDPARALRHD